MTIPRAMYRAGIGLATLVVALAGQISPATHAAGSVIRVGFVVDTTGSAAVYGVPIRNGARLAEDLINKKGGINGYRLDLQFANAASSETQAVKLFRQFSKKGRVLALIGPTLSSEAKVTDPIAQKAGLPVVATSNTAPGITSIGSYIFRLSLQEGEVVPLAVKVARKHLHFKKVAIIYDKVNAVTVADGAIFKATAQKDGLDVVDTETYATGDRDFSAQLTRIKNAHPDAILDGALVNEAIPMLTQARSLGIPSRVHFIGGNGFNSPALIHQAGAASEGAIVGTTYFPGSKRKLNRDFISQYRSRYTIKPDQFAAQAFDGVNILAAAIKSAGTTTNRAAVRRALTRVTNVPVVTGANGKFHFTSTRDSGESATVQIVRNGKFALYR